jgi:tetratricopeptide (TPR) repeat protein
VEALLDFQGGLEEYHRGDAWYQPVPAHFQWNLERIIETCAIKQVPLILFRPVTNLLDCPPMKFEADPSLPADRLQELNIQWQEAQSSLQSPERSTHHLEAVLEIDPDHAGAHFLLGRLQYQQGDYPAALKSLTRARDTDVCPLRATSDILGRIETVAAEHGIPLVDAEELLADLSPHGIVGNKVLVDHIHPTIEGHQILGEAAAQLCISQGIVDSPVANWQSVRKEMYREHLDSLGEAYFHRGKQRLEGLILWTQGRAKKIRDSH